MGQARGGSTRPILLRLHWLGLLLSARALARLAVSSMVRRWPSDGQHFPDFRDFRFK